MTLWTKRFKAISKRKSKNSMGGAYIRYKKIAHERLSVYIDFSNPVPDGKGGFTRREFIKMFIFESPKSTAERNHNKHVMLFAEKLLVERRTELLTGRLGIYNRANLNKDFLEFLLGLCRRKGNLSNYHNYKSVYKYLKKFCGKCTMADITEEFCNLFREFLLTTCILGSNRTLSKNSAASYFNKFRAAVHLAFQERLLATNVLERVKGIAAEDSKREFATEEELNTLVNTMCENGLLKRAALFSALTGLRWSDMEKLKWMDIQKTDSCYFLHIIQQKTGSTIVHPISENAVLILGPQGPSEQRIFYGLKYSASNNDKLKRWILRAGIHKKLGLHAFRHSYATLLLNKGADIYTVSKMLGHKNIKTTQIYSKVLTETKIKAANLINIEIN